MITADLKRTYSITNLTRAWKWIKSSNEAYYKNYFRMMYSSYAAAESSYLKSLQKRLNNETYQPSRITKIYIPKPSGILRPITLLSIEDQIVYQAFANQVAIRLSRRNKKRCFKENFGHIYAGTNSNWFYIDWRKCFSKFNSTIINTYNAGYDFTATFDLTACYDSIDHTVLGYYLSDLNFSPEFTSSILTYLGSWTGVNHDRKKKRIYLGHGIPQGPLASGIFSELLLQAFDRNDSLPKNVKYYRYVDDIRLLAKNEKDLRKSLIAFDYSSKYIGLFPQSSKINIHKITNIYDEIKTVSYLPEQTYNGISLDQDSTHKRINQLSLRYKISDQTKFKYVLASALPRSNQSKRLIKILIKNPHLYNTITSYLSRYKKINKTIGKELYKILSSDDPPYFSLQSEILRNTHGRIDGMYKNHFTKYCEKRWKELKKIEYADDFCKSLMKWLLSANKISYSQLAKLLLNDKYSVWFRTRVLFYVDIDTIGKPSYEAVLNKIIQEYEGDLSVAASYLMLLNDCEVQKPSRKVKHLPSVGLKEFRLIRSMNAPDSEIPNCLREITGANLPKFDWKRDLGFAQHKNIQNKIMLSRAYLRTDPTAFILSLDVLMDNILDLLFRHDGSLGTYILGNIGSCLGNPSSRFAVNYPILHNTCVMVHNLRKDSDLAHPINRSTGNPTKRIKYSQIKDLKPYLNDAFKEFIISW